MARKRKKIELQIGPLERARLEDDVRHGRVTVKRRSKGLLMLADGENVSAVCKELRVQRVAVSRWVEAYKKSSVQEEVALNAEMFSELERAVASKHSSTYLKKGCHIVLLRAKGVPAVDIAEAFDISTEDVDFRVEMYAKRGLLGLKDKKLNARLSRDEKKALEDGFYNGMSMVFRRRCFVVFSRGLGISTDHIAKMMKMSMKEADEAVMLYKTGGVENLWPTVDVTEALKSLPKHTEETADTKKRMHAVLLYEEGLPARMVQKLLGVDRHHVPQWAATYRKGGADALTLGDLDGPVDEVSSGDDSMKELVVLWKHGSPEEFQERCYAMILRTKGFAWDAVAAHVGTSRSVVKSWAARYRKGGIRALWPFGIARQPYQKRLDKEGKEALRKTFLWSPDIKEKVKAQCILLRDAGLMPKEISAVFDVPNGTIVSWLSEHWSGCQRKRGGKQKPPTPE